MIHGYSNSIIVSDKMLTERETKVNAIESVVFSPTETVKMKLVTISLKLRSNMFGSFVKLKDHEDLLNKGMVRFASYSQIYEEEWLSRVLDEKSCKVFAIDDITDICCSNYSKNA